MSRTPQKVVGLLPGRREANKLAKLARIRRAAKDVFSRKGFEAATIREIAAAADVAFGTLFLYAKDKQDLLLLLFDEEVQITSDRAFRKVKSEHLFMDQLVEYFSEFYSFFCAMPQLSRDMMKEITFTGGIVSKRMWAGLKGIEQHVARLVAQAQARGEVSPSMAPDLAAHVIFSIYRIQIRHCLSEDVPDIAGNLHKLRRQLEVLFFGLASATAAVAELESMPTVRVAKVAAKRGKAT